MARLTPQYCAGYFDGEGCVHASFGSGRTVSCISTKLRIGSTDYAVLKEFQRQYGGSLNKVKKYKLHHKQSWAWLVCGAEAEEFAKAILPYSVVKKGQLQQFLKLRKLLYRHGRGRIPLKELRERERLVTLIGEMKFG